MNIKAIEDEINNCAARDVSVLIAPAAGGDAFISYNPDKIYRSASVIKVIIMLAVLDACDNGELSVSDVCPVKNILSDSEVFEYGKTKKCLDALLYYMITQSDNTSTNAIIDIIGMERVNSYCRNVLGLKSTVLRRKMLDWDAVAAGRENTTSCSDMRCVFTKLYNGEILCKDSRERAMMYLKNQRCRDSLLRYVSSDIYAAHKTGGLDYLNHDCGLFRIKDNDLFASVFVDGSPDDELYAKRFIGRLGQIMYN